MAGLVRRSLDSPDEIRSFEGDGGQINVVFTDSGSLGRAVFEPGWRWSTNVKPIAQTETCEAAHTDT